MSDWREAAQNPEVYLSMKYDDPRLDAFAEELEDEYGIPPGILVALKNAGERTPNDEGGWGATSNRQAKGLMQFIPSTMELQNGMFRHDTSNPFESLAAAALYVDFTLKNQYDGDVALAIVDYNTGWTNTKKFKETGRLPDETSGYLNRVATYLSTTYKERLSERLRLRQERREQNGERTGGNARPSTSERGRGNSGNEGLTEANSPSVDGASEVGGSP